MERATKLLHKQASKHTKLVCARDSPMRSADNRFGGARIRLGTLGRSVLADLPLETPRNLAAGNIAGQSSAICENEHRAHIPALPLRRRTRSRTGSLAADEGLLSTIEERSNAESLLSVRFE